MWGAMQKENLLQGHAKKLLRFSWQFPSEEPKTLGNNPILGKGAGTSLGESILELSCH